MIDSTRSAEWEAALANGRFEEVQEALEAVVAVLESGNISLDDSIACYTLGMRLADRCEKMLAEAELAIVVLEELEPPGEDDDPEDDDSFDPEDVPSNEIPF